MLKFDIRISVLNMITQQTILISTDGRGFYDITTKVNSLLHDSPVENGLCHVFIQHTSASLLICENADPSVRHDVEQFFSKIVIDGDESYHHSYEGPDDMSGHLRTILTETSIVLPVTERALNLGTWQGIYLFEHRYRAHKRKLVITFYG